MIINIEGLIQASISKMGSLVDLNQRKYFRLLREMADKTYLIVRPLTRIHMLKSFIFLSNN